MGYPAALMEPISGTKHRIPLVDPRCEGPSSGGASMVRYSATTFHNLNTWVAVAGWGWLRFSPPQGNSGWLGLANAIPMDSYHG